MLTGMNFGGEDDGATIGISHDRRCDRGERNAERKTLPTTRSSECPWNGVERLSISRTKAN